MSAPFEYWKIAPQAIPALAAATRYIHDCGLDRKLVNLLYLRASQLNGCAYCTDMHIQEALADGETPQRLNVLVAWREAPQLYTKAEQAALTWTEELTRMADATGAQIAQRDAAFEELRLNFTDKQVVDLTVAIASINSWNRLGAGFRRPPPTR